MMRFRSLIWLLVIALPVLSGCTHKSFTSVPKLQVSIHIPQPFQTRADEGSVPSETEAEDRIHTLQIWVFLSRACAGHPAGTCIGYLAPDPLYLRETSETLFALPLEPAVANEHPDVDVYVLANAASTGHGDLDANTSQSTLNSLVMDGTVFGLRGNKPACTEVPEEGLPFAGVGKSMKMKGDYPVMKLDVVTLTRAVSKLRFVFSQLADSEGPFSDCSVTGIQIGGSAISSAEYVFNDRVTPYKIVPNLYETARMDFAGLASGQIALNEHPEDYAFSGQTAREYELLIQQGIEDGVLTSCGLSYLRETNRKLSGRIDYVLQGIPGYAEFEMKDEGDFARNHNWIVYLYFTRDAIRFTVSWTPWEEGHDFYLTD